MAPKQRNKSMNNSIDVNKRKNNRKSKSESKNWDKNEEISSESIDASNALTNGLRRSKRSKRHSNTTPKSKYFMNSDSEDNGSDDTIGNEEEFKPKVKKQSSIKPIKRKSNSNNESNSSSEEEEWEDVEENAVPELDDYNPVIPTEGVEITINESVAKPKRKFDLNDLIRQRINRFKRELQSNKHKTSLLLLISRAFYLNNSVNNELIKAIALSITLNELKAPKKLSIKFLNDFIDWFKKKFELKYTKNQSNESMIESLQRCLEQRVALNSCELNLTFIALIRSIDQKYNTRLCYVLNAVELKPNDLILSEKQLETQRKPSTHEKCSNKTKSNKSKTNKSKSKKRKVVSSDSESEEMVEPNENALELWVEIYVESERKWICLDLSNNIVDKPLEIASKSLPQLLYVIGLDSKGYIREVTQRYRNDWMSVSMKKHRTDQNWWTQTLNPFQRKTKTAAEKTEDLEFEEKMSSTPLPTKVSEYKNHPLYVLKKDLLKFQGIYPSDAPPLGFIRGEPVFARECVQLLRSRETWLRFARTVKVGETAYKLVKSRPKWDKYAKVWRRDMPLDLFGEWQTQPYDPPEAKDGIVPRNGYGNIDLFQPCMLPKGCVHLQLPGLLRIANKLKIDCVPAITGFDNNCGGGCHPVMDGFIVCKEFEEVLIAAWDEEQEIARQREIDKKEKRVLENWKKLIKGLLIREKVKKKYRFSDEENDETEIESDN